MHIKPVDFDYKKTEHDDFPSSSKEKRQVSLWSEKIADVYSRHGFEREKQEKYTCDASVGFKGKTLNILAEYQCLAAMIEALQSLHLEIPFEICINDVTSIQELMKDVLSSVGEKVLLELMDEMDGSSSENLGLAIHKKFPTVFNEKDAAAFVDCFRKRPPQARTQAPLNLIRLYQMLIKEYPELSTKIHFFPGMIKSAYCYSKMFFEFRLQIDGKSICIGKGGRQKVESEERVEAGFDLHQIYAASKAASVLKAKRNSTPEYFIAFENERLMEAALALFMTIKKKAEVSVLSNTLSEQIRDAKQKGYPSVIAIKKKMNLF